MQQKSIYLLIGQKGSGKSFIGTIFDKEFGIQFVRVEDWAKQIKRDREINDESYLRQVFAEIEKGIRQTLLGTDKLVFESTGLTEYFDAMLESLKKDFKVTTIAIKADSATCLERVRSRDLKIHINVSDDQVLMVNRKVLERNMKTDFYIENENRSKEALMTEVGKILG